MRERMSLGCNEDKFMRKKSKKKTVKTKVKMWVQMTMLHMLQVLHKLHKEKRCVGFVVEIIWPMFVHTKTRSLGISGKKIPWNHTIHF